MTTYDERKRAAEEWENEVGKKFTEYGFRVHPFGLGQMQPGFHDILVSLGNDNQTATFIRFLPDWIAVKDNNCLLLDAKYDMRQDTGNYSIELLSRDWASRLSIPGVNIIIVFNGWRAEWVSDLKIFRKITDEEKLRVNKGSGTPLGLIRIDSVPTLEDFLRREGFIQP